VARAVQRAQDAPVNVVVACVPCVSNPRVSVAEEEFATAAAVQNFLLSLAASGVDALLTTGDLAQSEEVARLVGLSGDGARLMGLVNVGYRNPERPIPARPETPIARVAAWIGPQDPFPTAEDAT
jgi:nitroreductase